MWFQSLLFWNWLQKFCAQQEANSKKLVSILVILELALEAAVVSSTLFLTFRFNPCYSGIGFRRVNKPRACNREAEFQSLLFWNWLQKHSERNNGAMNGTFQSLLFWNWLQKQCSSIAHVSPCLVSILVILELALEGEPYQFRSRKTSVSILVILELALEVLFFLRHIGYAWRFNPCYSGIGFRSGRRGLGHPHKYCFNPCYSGIGFRRRMVNYIVQALTCFNPCYSGIGFRRRAHLPRVVRVKVSILVILELALEGEVNSRPCINHRVSILVILELALEERRLITWQPRS